MTKTENSGGHCEYYHAHVKHPQNPNQTVGYIANCEDIIQALGLTFDEGCEFKSIWRRGRGRQGFRKAESTALRDAIKAVHYAKRVLALEERKAAPLVDATCLEGRVALEERTTRYPWLDWSEYPANLKWVAMDGNGIVFLYENEPVSRCVSWQPTKGESREIRSLAHLATAWRESLEARP